MDWEHDLVRYIMENYPDTVVFPVPEAEVLRRFNVPGYLPNLLGSVSMLDKDPYEDQANDVPIDDTMDEHERVSANSDIAMGDGMAW